MTRGAPLPLIPLAKICNVDFLSAVLLDLQNIIGGTADNGTKSRQIGKRRLDPTRQILRKRGLFDAHFPRDLRLGLAAMLDFEFNVF